MLPYGDLDKLLQHLLDGQVLHLKGHKAYNELHLYCGTPDFEDRQMVILAMALAKLFSHIYHLWL